MLHVTKFCKQCIESTLCLFSYAQCYMPHHTQYRTSLPHLNLGRQKAVIIFLLLLLFCLFFVLALFTPTFLDTVVLVSVVPLFRIIVFSCSSACFSGVSVKIAACLHFLAFLTDFLSPACG